MAINRRLFKCNGTSGGHAVLCYALTTMDSTVLQLINAGSISYLGNILAWTFFKTWIYGNCEKENVLDHNSLAFELCHILITFRHNHLTYQISDVHMLMGTE